MSCGCLKPRQHPGTNPEQFQWWQFFSCKVNLIEKAFLCDIVQYQPNFEPVNKNTCTMNLSTVYRGGSKM